MIAPRAWETDGTVFRNALFRKLCVMRIFQHSVKRKAAFAILGHAGSRAIGFVLVLGGVFAATIFFDGHHRVQAQVSTKPQVAAPAQPAEQVFSAADDAPGEATRSWPT